jgi:hypothetical protein
MRLIDMNTLWQCETCFHNKYNGCDTWCDAGEGYRPAASKLSPFDPESLRPKGRWVMKETMIRSPFAKNAYCSECLEEASYAHNYCPNCGAKMEE